MKTDPGNLLPTQNGGKCLKISKRDRCPLAGNSKAEYCHVMQFRQFIIIKESVSFICIAKLIVLIFG